MPTEGRSVRQIADFFETCKAEVLAQWQQETRALLQKLNLDQPTITEHVPETIDLIIDDLDKCCTGEISTEDIAGSPSSHGIQRFREGLNVGEVVTEFNLLRSAFATVAEQHGLLIPGEAMRIINHRIDGAVRLAVMAFAHEQAHLRQTQDDEHLAFLAHDLRTPLSAISLLVQELSLTLDPAFAAANAETLDILRRNLTRVEELIKRVLSDRARPAIHGSSFKPEFRVFELWPVVQRLLADLDSVAARQEITVTNAVPRRISVNADAGLIAQVFQNLLSNAFTYSGGGQVIITAAEKGDRVTCCVRDNGSGIAPELLGRIFEKSTSDPGKSGTGLGLAIVNQIIEAHGGAISVESAPDSGASFCFTLPTPP